jgi:hypothetical protein
MMTTRWSLPLLLLWGPSLARQACAQEYRNLDAGFPIRVEDATVTERYALDLDLANFRFDALSAGRKRVQLEPSLSYGLFPGTEVWLRVPTYFRERTISPRTGIAGIGTGAMYQLNMETFRIPAVAIASEVFIPTGPNALPPSYSFKTAFTRSFTPGRIHFNAGVSSYATRIVVTDCLPLIQGSTCPATFSGTPLPPLDGPCAMAPESDTPSAWVPSMHTFPAVFVLPMVAEKPRVVTHAHWLIGAAADKSFPLSSIIFLGDIFAERFEGIGRKTDWTAELGTRKQLNPQAVFAGAIGRHFRGTTTASFFILGATLSRPLQLFGDVR